MTTGAEFRGDLRAIPVPAAGSGNAAARKLLSAEELAPLTQLSNLRSALALAQSLLFVGSAVALGVWLWPSPWVAACVLAIGVLQHGLFILSHEAAHYRLFSNRRANDAAGTALGMSSGVSMHTYRVTHRLHHNHLYGVQDPDTAIHGGYPRGKAYLAKKLAQDVIGLNAYKTYAYFFGAPSINSETGNAINPLNDTSPELRQAARRDRWRVLAAQAAAPVLAYALGGWQAFFVYLVLWPLPMLTALQPVLRLRAICEHGAPRGTDSPLTAARSNRTSGSATNWLARALLFPHHVNYHLEHHLYPAVPHYNLPKLHALLVQKGALEGAEVRDVGETLALIFAARKPKAAKITPDTPVEMA